VQGRFGMKRMPLRAASGSPPSVQQSSVHKILEVDAHIAAAISGLTPDAQAMVEFGRVECQSHRFT
jgi:20S proteasome subunit alpha 5